MHKSITYANRRGEDNAERWEMVPRSGLKRWTLKQHFPQHLFSNPEIRTRCIPTPTDRGTCGGGWGSRAGTGTWTGPREKEETILESMCPGEPKRKLRWGAKRAQATCARQQTGKCFEYEAGKGKLRPGSGSATLGLLLAVTVHCLLSVGTRNTRLVSQRAVVHIALGR